MSKQNAAVLAAAAPPRFEMQASGLPPRLTSKEWQLIHQVGRICVTHDIDYNGAIINEGYLTWISLSEIDRVWYQQIAWWSRAWGYCDGYSYELMAERVKWKCSREKAKRRCRRLANLGLLWFQNKHDERTGEFVANRWAPLHPLRPWGKVVAIEVNGQVVMINPAYTQADLPPVPTNRKAERRQRKENAERAKQYQVKPEDLMLALPRPFATIARDERVTDLVSLSRVWKLYEARVEKGLSGKLDRLYNKYGYFRDLLRIEKEQLAALAAQAAEVGDAMPAGWPANTPPPNPKAEAQCQVEFLISTATRLLAEGADVDSLRRELPNHPMLPHFQRTVGLKAEWLEKALKIAQERAPELREHLEASRKLPTPADKIPKEWANWVVTRADVFRRRAGVPRDWIGEYLAKDQDDPLKPMGLREWTSQQLQALYERLTGT